MIVAGEAAGIETQWRAPFGNAEVNALHAAAFRHAPLEDDWVGQTGRHSLGWVCARMGGDLVGFVNVAWDGGVHAFLLDTMVDPDFRRLGIGRGLAKTAVCQVRMAGCEWLHVDFEPHLRPFYDEACGFRPTDAGLIRL